MLNFNHKTFNFERWDIDITDPKEVYIYNRHQKLLTDALLLDVEDWKGVSKADPKQIMEYVRRNNIAPEDFLKSTTPEEIEKERLQKILWEKIYGKGE